MDELNELKEQIKELKNSKKTFMDHMKDIGVILTVVTPIFAFTGWVSSVVVSSITQTIAESTLSLAEIHRDDLNTRIRLLTRRIETLVDKSEKTTNDTLELERLRNEKHDYDLQLKELERKWFND